MLVTFETRDVAATPSEISAKRPSERRPPAPRGSSVAQICNLPYRRIAFCESRIFVRQSRKRTLCRLQIGDTADYKSALRSGRAGGRRSNFAEISEGVVANAPIFSKRGAIAETPSGF